MKAKLILHAYFARSPDGSMVMFRYYLLGGNTAAPSGLYARLCHAFLVSDSSNKIFFERNRKLCGGEFPPKTPPPKSCLNKTLPYCNYQLVFYILTKTVIYISSNAKKDNWEAKMCYYYII